MKHGTIVGRTECGREIWGVPSTKYAHLCGLFWGITDIAWGGGKVTMPYMADPNNSRYLTDEELEKYYPVGSVEEMMEARKRLFGF